MEARQRLMELEQRQTFIAVQQANIIDRTIALTDRISIIGFLASILLTAILGFFLVRYTNTSLKRLKTGTERIGAGDLNYRIDDFDDNSELGELATTPSMTYSRQKRPLMVPTPPRASSWPMSATNFALR